MKITIKTFLQLSAMVILCVFVISSCKKEKDNEDESNNNGSTNTWTPCPGTPTVTDADGNVYNTVLIGNQCWMKENLKVGTRIDSTKEMTDNGVIEKYCYDDDPANCDVYGGLYQWNELMGYSTQESSQGICPNGWHVPSDEEWKILEGSVDSEYGVGDSIWNSVDWRGYDAGDNIKSKNGWYSGGNGSDTFSFSAIPGGVRGYDGYLNGLGHYAYFWSSTEYISNHAWGRILHFSNEHVSRYFIGKESGFSVRCIKD